MRLIDADALMEIIRQHDYLLTVHIKSTDKGMFTIGCQQAVDEMATIDPVHAAGGCYCRECKFAYINSSSAKSGVVLCRYFTNRSEGVQMIMQQTDFCSHGERRKIQNMT